MSTATAWFSLTTNPAAAAGYVEMPETTQVPTLEKDSMLLDLDVPALRERDPDPMGGPRLNVTEFRLQGLVEYPELGITRDKLIQRVEAIRFDLMRQDEVGKWGYTEKEVSEIADMMGDIESEIQDEHVGSVEVQKLVFLIREQRRRRGVTLGMIESVADTITQFYREKGFILAKAYIPEQKVRDGVVTLTLLLGELGSVSVSNQTRVSESLIKRAFAPYIDEPVTSERLEEALYLVNDIPGLSARSVLAPGSQVGDTHLNVNIQQEQWYSGNVKLDNYGSESTSRNRLYADMYIHNPSGLGDELYLAILKTYIPDNSTFGAIRYNSFWGLPKLRTSVGLSTNEFVSEERQALSDSPLYRGESLVADIAVDYHFSRLRTKNISSGLKYTVIDTEFDVYGQDQPSEARTLSLNVNFDFLNQKWKQLYAGNVMLHSSKTIDPNRFEIGNLERDTVYLTYDLSLLMFAKIPFTQAETRILLKSAGQYAGESLSNILQFSLSGNGRTRIFSVNGPRADDGLYVGADWLLPFPDIGDKTFFGQPYSRVFQPYLFLDGAYGSKQPLTDFDSSSYSTLVDMGIGLKLKWGGFNMNIFAGHVIEDKNTDSQSGTGNKIETPTHTVGGELTYSF